MHDREAASELRIESRQLDHSPSTLIHRINKQIQQIRIDQCFPCDKRTGVFDRPVLRACEKVGIEIPCKEIRFRYNDDHISFFISKFRIFLFLLVVFAKKIHAVIWQRDRMSGSQKDSILIQYRERWLCNNNKQETKRYGVLQDRGERATLQDSTVAPQSPLKQSAKGIKGALLLCEFVDFLRETNGIEAKL